MRAFARGGSSFESARRGLARKSAFPFSRCRNTRTGRTASAPGVWRRSARCSMCRSPTSSPAIPAASSPMASAAIPRAILSEPGATELLQAYAQIGSLALRNAVVRLARDSPATSAKAACPAKRSRRPPRRCVEGQPLASSFGGAGDAVASAPASSRRRLRTCSIFGKPCGDSRPACARSPIQSLSSATGACGRGRRESVQLSPSAFAKTRASESSPSL